jgi:hypothetical protein
MMLEHYDKMILYCFKKPAEEEAKAARLEDWL